PVPHRLHGRRRRGEHANSTALVPRRGAARLDLSGYRVPAASREGGGRRGGRSVLGGRGGMLSRPSGGGSAEPPSLLPVRRLRRRLCRVTGGPRQPMVLCLRRPVQSGAGSGSKGG